MVVLLIAALAFQPAGSMLRALFADELARAAAQYGDADLRTARAARDLGLFLAREGDRAAARDALDQAVRAEEATLGPAAPQTLAGVAELAAVSEPARAEKLWLRASASPDAAVAAQSFGALGDLRDRAGDRAGAIRCYRRAVEREEAAAGRNDIKVAVRLNTLALAVDPAEAIPLLERALRISTGRVGDRRVETASIQINLAGRLLSLGRTRPALQHAAAAVATFEETLGPEHPRTVAGRKLLAAVLAEAGPR